MELESGVNIQDFQLNPPGAEGVELSLQKNSVIGS